jgi:hypothetical protein
MDTYKAEVSITVDVDVEAKSYEDARKQIDELVGAPGLEDCSRGKGRQNPITDIQLSNVVIDYIENYDNPDEEDDE